MALGAHKHTHSSSDGLDSNGNLIENKSHVSCCNDNSMNERDAAPFTFFLNHLWSFKRNIFDRIKLKKKKRYNGLSNTIDSDEMIFIKNSSIRSTRQRCLFRYNFLRTHTHGGGVKPRLINHEFTYKLTKSNLKCQPIVVILLIIII